MNLPFKKDIRRADRDNSIDIFISEDHDDVLADGIWQQFFDTRPDPLTCEEKRDWIALNREVALGSDAFFPFGDCVEKAAEFGIKTIIQPGGSIRDAESIEAADRLGIAMVFTGRRHFKH